MTLHPVNASVYVPGRTSRIVEGDVCERDVLAVPVDEPMIALVPPTLQAHESSVSRPRQMCLGCTPAGILQGPELVICA